MTPKEKAKQLFDKFIPFVNSYHYGSIAYAKQFALISVDEILDLKHIVTLRRNMHEMELEYWMEVKQEIEKL